MKIKPLFYLFTFLLLIILSFFPKAAAFENANTLAKCLADNQFTMYGTDNCSACNAQRNSFGDGAFLLPYINCSIEVNLCAEKRITGYPTWEDKSGKRYSGVIPLDIIAKLSGCTTLTPIPEKVQEKPIITLNQIIASFTAGLLSFLAPCLLPLFPTFLSVTSGFTFSQLYGLDFGKIRPRVFFSTIFFVIGFTLIYTMLGATGSIVGQVLDQYLLLLLKGSGVILIALGLLQLGVIKINALEFDYAWRVQKKLARLGYLTATIAGMASALSWIPCVGPLLTPILLMAAESKTALIGALLLFIYSLGLTTPFILGGLFFPFIYKNLHEHRIFLHRLSQIAGIILILFGIIILIGKYQQMITILYSFVGK